MMTGFQDGIKDKIIAAQPHILVLESGGRGVADAAAVAGRASRPIPGVHSATPFVLQQALFTVQGGGATGGLLRGVDLDAPAVRASHRRAAQGRQPRPAPHEARSPRSCWAGSSPAPSA